MNILLSFNFGYLRLDTISIDSIIMNIIISISCCMCENNMSDSVNDVTGIGIPMNVFVGPTCSVMIVLYLHNLRIPQDNINIDAIIVSGCLYVSKSITAGATPNEITSASESIVSPNTSFVEVGNFLAKGPSIASNNTASISNIAVSMMLL